MSTLNISVNIPLGICTVRQFLKWSLLKVSTIYKVVLGANCIFRCIENVLLIRYFATTKPGPN